MPTVQQIIIDNNAIAYSTTVGPSTRLATVQQDNVDQYQRHIGALAAEIFALEATERKSDRLQRPGGGRISNAECREIPSALVVLYCPLLSVHFYLYCRPPDN